MTPQSFEKYPLWMVLACNAVGWGVYAIGVYLTLSFGVVWAVLYALYCLWMEGRVLWKSCRKCWYFGKRCAFGKGLIAAWFFKKNTEKSFTARKISWKDIAPDFLVSLVPLGVGIFLLVRDFSWLVLLLVAALVLFGSVGTGMVRGQIACKYCKQRELGCPAEQLFNKTKQVQDA